MKKIWMQRLTATLCALLLLLCALPVNPAHAANEAGYINASGVNFRTGPATSYASQDKLAKNTAVTVTGSSGNWTALTVDSTGKSGYVFSRYVTIGKTTAVSPDSKAGYINATSVNFRKGPATSYTSLGLLGKNTAVTVLGSSGNWYKLTVDSTGKTGYVFSRYVTLGSGASSPVIEPSAGNGGYINASGVNFRTGPSTRYKSQGLLAKNTAVTVTGSSGSWTKLTVTSSGKSGYVFSRYVTQNAASTPAVVTPKEQPGFINVASVNFRTGPSSSYRSIGILHRDEAVTVLSSSGKWYKLIVNATQDTGYVYARYVTLGAAPTPTPGVIAPPAAGGSTGDVIRP